MQFDDTKMPSDKKFGVFFSAVFSILFGYFFMTEALILAATSVFVVVLLLFATLSRTDWLTPFNVLWMRFGIFLGMFISPIVLGFIFFTIFTPISLFMNMVGRDELRLRFVKKNSLWIERDTSSHNSSFRNQY